jgi:hypothetical protein
MGWTKELWRLMQEEELSFDEAKGILIAERNKRQNEHRENQEELLGRSSER